MFGTGGVCCVCGGPGLDNGGSLGVDGVLAEMVMFCRWLAMRSPSAAIGCVLLVAATDDWCWTTS